MDFKEISDQLRICSNAFSALADLLSGAPEQSGQSESEETKVEVAHTLQEVRQVLALKAREGHTEEIKALLSSFNANTLSEVKPESYEELLKKVEVM